MITVECKNCTKKFQVKPSHHKLGYGVYCSRKCQYEGYRSGKDVSCYQCGREIWKSEKALKGSKSGKYFCSKSCQTVWRNHLFSGPDHPNWRDGGSVDYRKILSETGATKECKLCGCNDVRVLAAHHLDKNRRNNNKDNLVWLCMNCHFLVHRHNKNIYMAAIV